MVSKPCISKKRQRHYYRQFMNSTNFVVGCITLVLFFHFCFSGHLYGTKSAQSAATLTSGFTGEAISIVQNEFKHAQKNIGDHPNSKKENVFDSRNSIVISSHQRLVLYDVVANKYKVLNEGNGVYYGVFPASPSDTEPKSITGSFIWVVGSEKYKFKYDESKSSNGLSDLLLKIGLKNGDIQETRRLDSSFTHDTILSLDKKSVFVADTQSGSILQLSYLNLVPLKSFDLFTKKNHINTLAQIKNDSFWVMLHNLGSSAMVEVDIKTGKKLCVVENVGLNAHGLVKVQGEDAFYVLSSKEAKLVKVKVPLKCLNHRVHHKKSFQAEAETIWQYGGSSARTIPEETEPIFLKGLLVVDGIAYVGVSKYENSRKARNEVECSLMAIDISKRQLVWIRESADIGTKGLINVLSSPLLEHTSTYQEIQRNQESSRLLPSELPGTEGLIYSKIASVYGQEVERCVRQYMSNMSASASEGPAFGLTGKNNAFIRLPLRFDIKRLQSELHLLEKDIGWGFREDVNNHFLLLVNRNGVVDDEDTLGPFVPVEGRLAKANYVKQVFESFGALIGRSRFMMLAANSTLKRHRDRVSHVYSSSGMPSPSSGYWGRRFRVHIPIISPKSVRFYNRNVGVHMEEGAAYLFDNANPHMVENPSDIDRVHLIFDTLGSVDLYRLIQQSTVITYDGMIQAYSPSHSRRTKLIVPESRVFEEVKIGNVFENFTDSPVFEPMSPHFVRGYLLEYLLRMVSEESAKYEVIKEIFLDFYLLWVNICYKPWDELESKKNMFPVSSSPAFISGDLRRAQLVCKDSAKSLLLSILAVDTCANTPVELYPSYPNRTIQSSLPLGTVIESFSKALYYECTGLYLNSDIEGPPCISNAKKKMRRQL